MINVMDLWLVVVAARGRARDIFVVSFEPLSAEGGALAALGAADML